MSAIGPARPAAFFDLDRTLIDVNSALLYARYERRHGRIGRLRLIQSGFWTLVYHLSLLDIDRVYQKAAGMYRGVLSEAVDRRTRDWFASDVAHRLQPGARAALEHHRALGHPLVLLTNSSCYAAAAAAGEWGLDDWIANVFPTDAEGKLLGTVMLPLCYGEGKVLRAEAWAESHGADLSVSAFYSDSYSDVPMLERVGHPFVVNPDPRLRRLAKRRDWPVLDWHSQPIAGERNGDHRGFEARNADRARGRSLHRDRHQVSEPLGERVRDAD